MWLHLNFKKNSTKQNHQGKIIIKDAWECEGMTYLTYLAATQHLWHSCMSMWMHVHGIKTRNHEADPNLNMWKSKWITSMWNKILKLQIYEKGTKIEVLHVKSKKKSEKLGFLGRIMHTHEQAFVRIIKPVYVAKIMCTWASA